MTTVDTIEALEELYGTPSEVATRKVADSLVPVYRRWIMASRFCVLTTVGPEGTDGSPRGDVGPVVTEIDDRTLAMPDWRGNDRLDSLRKIVRDGRVSCMFMVPGSDIVVRVNGTAQISADPDLIERFERKELCPRSVILISIGEIYFQCSRALMRSGLWQAGDQSAGLPSTGDIVASMTRGEVDGAKFDSEWPDRALKKLW